MYTKVGFFPQAGSLSLYTSHAEYGIHIYISDADDPRTRETGKVLQKIHSYIGGSREVCGGCLYICVCIESQEEKGEP